MDHLARDGFPGEAEEFLVVGQTVAVRVRQEGIGVGHHHLVAVGQTVSIGVGVRRIGLAGVHDAVVIGVLDRVGEAVVVAVAVDGVHDPVAVRVDQQALVAEPVVAAVTVGVGVERIGLVVLDLGAVRQTVAVRVPVFRVGVEHEQLGAIRQTVAVGVRVVGVRVDAVAVDVDDTGALDRVGDAVVVAVRVEGVDQAVVVAIDRHLDQTRSIRGPGGQPIPGLVREVPASAVRVFLRVGDTVTVRVVGIRQGLPPGRLNAVREPVPVIVRIGDLGIEAARGEVVFVAVGPAVTVGVEVRRVGAERQLLTVVQAVVVTVDVERVDHAVAVGIHGHAVDHQAVDAYAVVDAVVVGVGIQRVGAPADPRARPIAGRGVPALHFGPVRERVRVGELVEHVGPVGDLLTIRQAIAVRVLVVRVGQRARVARIRAAAQLVLGQDAVVVVVGVERVDQAVSVEVVVRGGREADQLEQARLQAVPVGLRVRTTPHTVGQIGGGVHLEAVHQAVPVGIGVRGIGLTGVHDAVVIGVLDRVGNAVVVRVPGVLQERAQADLGSVRETITITVRHDHRLCCDGTERAQQNRDGDENRQELLTNQGHVPTASLRPKTATKIHHFPASLRRAAQKALRGAGQANVR